MIKSLVIIFLSIIFTGCASVSQLNIPSECRITPETNQAIVIVCPHKINIELE